MSDCDDIIRCALTLSRYSGNFWGRKVVVIDVHADANVAEVVGWRQRAPDYYTLSWEMRHVAAFKRPM